MVFIPPINPPDDDNNDKREKPPRNPSLKRRLAAESRSSSRKKLKNSLGTAQGTSTLKIVLMYSVLGMILSWVLPVLVAGFKPDIDKEQAEFYGIACAMIITVILLIVTLLKGIIMRNISTNEKSNNKDITEQMFKKKE